MPFLDPPAHLWFDQSPESREQLNIAYRFWFGELCLEGKLPSWNPGLWSVHSSHGALERLHQKFEMLVWYLELKKRDQVRIVPEALQLVFPWLKPYERHQRLAKPPVRWDNLVGERPLVFGIEESLLSQYEEAVRSGFRSLKKAFLNSCRDTRYLSLLITVRQQHVHSLLFLARIPADVKGFPNMNLRPDELLQLQAEATIFLTQKEPALTIVRTRSLAEFERRAKGPFFETEAWLNFLEWLENADIPKALEDFERERSRQEPKALVAPMRWRHPQPEGSLRKLYSLLRRDNYLSDDCSWEHFYIHFRNPSTKPIPWAASNRLLVHWMLTLVARQYLPSSYATKYGTLLSQHFLNRKGRIITPASLFTGESKATRAPIGVEKLETLLSELDTI